VESAGSWAPVVIGQVDDGLPSGMRPWPEEDGSVLSGLDVSFISHCQDAQRLDLAEHPGEPLITCLIFDPGRLPGMPASD